MRTGLLLAAWAVLALAQTTRQNAAALEERAEQLFREQRWADAATSAQAALQADSSSVNARLILGLIATREGKHAIATRHFEKAAALHPEDPRITGYLASSYLQEGRARDAEPLFRRVLALEPANRTAHFNLGLLLLQRGAAREAEGQFQFLSNGEPSDDAAATGILECRLMQKNLVGASESARQINQRLAPSDPERLRIASLLTNYKSWELAIQILEPIPVEASYGLESRYDLALAHFRAGGPEAAAKVLAETPRLLEQADAQHLLGDIEEKLGRLELARQALDRAATLDPRNEDIRFDRAVFQLEHDTSPSAVAAFRAGADAFPDSWRMQFGLGEAEYLAGDAGQAAETLLALVRKQPGVLLAYSLLGSLYDQAPAGQDRIYEALDSYVKTGAGDARTYTAFAKILNRRAVTTVTGKGATRAVMLLRRALTLDPGQMEAYLELAAIENGRRQFQESRKLLEKAASVSPEAPEPHYHLARLYQKLGMDHKAAVESQTFRELRRKAASAQVTLAVDLKKQPQ
jgi:tetratricopeptide (TPR) repeat protein